MCILQNKLHFGQDSCKSLKDKFSARTEDCCFRIKFKAKIKSVNLIVRVDKGVFLKHHKNTTDHSACLYVRLLSSRLNLRLSHSIFSLLLMYVQSSSINLKGINK